MKKFLSILLSLTLLLSVVALPVWAVDAAAMYTETAAAEVSAGDTFTYTISLSGSYMGYACTIPVIDGLTVETITTSDTDLGKATNVDKKADGSYLLSVLPSFDTTDAEKSLIATVAVKVNDDAPLGAITLSLDKVQVANNVGDKVADLQTHFASVTVVEKSVPVAVTGVALDQTTAEMNIGDTLTLHATVSPDNADNKSVTWKSDNTTVADVADGVVTAKAAGNANITVTTADGGFTASCAITVKKDETPIEDGVVISIGDTKGLVGKTITVPVYLESNPGLINVTIDISYDSNVFTLTNVEDTGLLSGAMHTDRLESPYRLTWANDTVAENIYVTGNLVNLTFSIAENAEVGDYAFAISPVPDGIMNFDCDTLDATFKNGTCTVKNYIPGDVNGDGAVTVKDRVALTRYLAKWSGYDDSTISFDAADLNGDGVITVKDRVILSRYLAKWSGYDTLS